MANNTAYDMALFQPREPRLVAMESNKKSAAHRRRHNSRQVLFNAIVYGLVALVVLGLMLGYIMGKVQLTEMNEQIQTVQTTLEEQRSELVRLESELAGLTSAEKISTYAQQQGLLPVDSNQIYYIGASDLDQVTLAESGNWFTRIWDAVCSFFS